jgi:tripartite-type tricarboxylate transporter receptor subunit TctC
MKTVLLFFVWAVISFSAHAAFPTKSVKLVLPFPAGGTTDLIGKMIKSTLEPVLKQTVLLDYRPGAGGTVGLSYASRQESDGYSMVLGSPTLILSPHLYKSLGYSWSDFIPVTMVGHVPIVLVAHPSVPVKGLSSLIDVARKNPGLINFGSGGVGTMNHLSVELLRITMGLDIIHVPYKGAQQASLGILSGEVDIGSGTVSFIAPFVNSTKLRGIVVLGPKQKLLPDVKTAEEEGYSWFEVSAWYALLVPKGTPDQTVEELNKAFGQASLTEEFKKTSEALGMVRMFTSVEDARRFVRREYFRWGNVIRKSDIKL